MCRLSQPDSEAVTEFKSSLIHLVCKVRHVNGSRMDLSKFLKMDPHLLVGLLNTELRNHCESLDDLVKTHNLDPELLIVKMTAAEYIYQPEQNQFR